MTEATQTAEVTAEDTAQTEIITFEDIGAAQCALQVRAAALEFAVKHHATSGSCENIVGTAKAFAAFLAGEQQTA